MRRRGDTPTSAGMEQLLTGVAGHWNNGLEVSDQVRTEPLSGELPVQLGKYEVLQRIAVGGMAEILLARSMGIEGFVKHVVIKRILPQFASEQRFLSMFADEARLAACLHHQNIAQVYDIGQDSGEVFFAMEFIHGQDVGTILREVTTKGQRLPLQHGLTIACGVAAGLAYAHERHGPDGEPLHIVHRDVSPSNILVSYEGGIKLVDFGIARATIRSTETRTGAVKGKLSYMSPEQCLGGDLDSRSDIFSLGTVLHELTTSARLFRRDPDDSDYVVMNRIVTGKVLRPSERVSSYPAELEAIVMKALALEPEQRYQTARELVSDLEAFASKERIAISSSSLSRYLTEVLGERPEPWRENTGNPALIRNSRPGSRRGTGSRSGEQSTERSTERSGEQSTERSTERSGERSMERSGERLATEPAAATPPSDGVESSEVSASQLAEGVSDFGESSVSLGDSWFGRESPSAVSLPELPASRRPVLRRVAMIGGAAAVLLTAAAFTFYLLSSTSTPPAGPSDEAAALTAPAAATQGDEQRAELPDPSGDDQAAGSVEEPGDESAPDAVSDTVAPELSDAVSPGAAEGTGDGAGSEAAPEGQEAPESAETDDASAAAQETRQPDDQGSEASATPKAGQGSKRSRRSRPAARRSSRGSGKGAQRPGQRAGQKAGKKAGKKSGKSGKQPSNQMKELIDTRW